MHLGLVTYNVAKDWDLATLLRVCKECRFEGVEFRTTHKHGVEPSLGRSERVSVRKQCVDSGMKQTSLGTVCEFHSPDPAIVRRNIDDCRAFAELARDIGARGVKVRPNGLPKEVEVEKTLEQIGRSLVECGKIAADCGVEVWMEVHGGGTSIPANARRIMDHCGHRSVGLTWNSNPIEVENRSVKAAFALLRPFIKCCHITDIWSDYPYKELFTLLRESRYDRYTLCEVGSAYTPDDGAEYLRKYRDRWEELGR